ncbi:unnamed protein product, partial [marine sediment metagenome]
AQYIKRFGALENGGYAYLPHSDSQAEFEGMCQYLRGVSNHTFFVEEAERYLRQGVSLGSQAFDLFNRGRNWGIGIYAVTRRIQTLSKDFFDLCQYCIFFKCGLTSREYIEKLIGKEAASELFNLEQYQFLAYDIEGDTYEKATLEISGGREHLETPEEQEERKKPEVVPKEQIKSVGEKPRKEEEVMEKPKPPNPQDMVEPPMKGKV